LTIWLVVELISIIWAIAALNSYNSKLQIGAPH
jgi:hypothetical protein